MKRTWPKNATQWQARVDACLELTEREREALKIQFIEWPPGASNLEYLTQRKMAARLGISVVTFNRHVSAGLFKLGLSDVPPRRKIPTTTQRALYDALEDDAVCDLCGRSLDRLPLPVDDEGWVSYGDLTSRPRFAAPVSIDHIVPVSRGGSDDLANLRVVHLFCNLSDGARKPIEELGPPQFGYVRRSEQLPNNRGPRKWIEPDPSTSAVVQFMMIEYATGHYSIASLVRLLNRRRRRFKGRRVSEFFRKGPREQADDILWTLDFHSSPRTERDLIRGYVPIVEPEVVQACAEQLERRADRIQRARQTRERRRAELSRSVLPLKGRRRREALTERLST